MNIGLADEEQIEPFDKLMGALEESRPRVCMYDTVFTKDDGSRYIPPKFTYGETGIVPTVEYEALLATKTYYWSYSLPYTDISELLSFYTPEELSMINANDLAFFQRAQYFKEGSSGTYSTSTSEIRNKMGLGLRDIRADYTGKPNISELLDPESVLDHESSKLIEPVLMLLAFKIVNEEVGSVDEIISKYSRLNPELLYLGLSNLYFEETIQKFINKGYMNLSDLPSFYEKAVDWSVKLLNKSVLSRRSINASRRGVFRLLPPFPIAEVKMKDPNRRLNLYAIGPILSACGIYYSTENISDLEKVNGRVFPPAGIQKEILQVGEMLVDIMGYCYSVVTDKEYAKLYELFDVLKSVFSDTIKKKVPQSR